MSRTIYQGIGWAVVLCVISTAALARNVHPALMRAFLKADSMVDLAEPAADWDKFLREDLRKSESPALAVNSLSSRYHVSPSVIASLMELWARTTILSWKETSDSSTEAAHRLLDAGFVALVNKTYHNTLVLEIAAEAITYIGRCNADTYRALVGGASDAASAWSVAAIGYCGSWLHAFSELHPEKAAAVEVRLALDGELARPESLALNESLASDYLRDHASADDFQLLRHFFAAQHVDELFDVGLMKQGLAFFEALPDGSRRTLMEAASAMTLAVKVDGLSVIEKIKTRDLTLDLAAARYVVGDGRDSPEIGHLASQLDASRSQLRCWHDHVPEEEHDSDDCQTKESLGKVALFDIVAFAPSEDPYDFIEFYYGGRSVESEPSMGSGLWTQALCKRLGTSRYASICDKAREFFQPWSTEHSSSAMEVDNEKFAHAAFMAVAGNEVIARAHALERELTAAVGPQPPAGFGNRSPTIDPLPSPFVQSRLPKSLRTVRGKADANVRAVTWPATFAALPSGFSPVRVERAGKRAVAISLSQNLDPSGEVSAGGYWIHLSQDGGRSWEVPLYTGLAERFPYVVRERSKLPILDGETLNVEVDIEKLDTASITYPPVALTSKRRARNLYLRIPITALRQDTDGDGITDIVEKHLLLDPENADSDGDGIADGRDSMPNVRHSSGDDPTQGAMAAVIERMFDVRMGPIIEGIDSGQAEDRLGQEFKTIRMGHTLSIEHPIFIQGNANDFATLDPSRMVLVYNKQQVAQLQCMTPDFHAVSFAPLILNEASDRGYLVWSTGWRGGTFRLVREGKKWKAFTLSQWIT